MITGNESSNLFDIHIIPEDKIQLRTVGRGRCPEIDYIISVEDSGLGTILHSSRSEVNHVTQLAAYAAYAASWYMREIQRKVLVRHPYITFIKSSSDDINDDVVSDVSL